MKILRKICSAVLCAAVAVFMVCSLAEGKEKAGALSAEDFVSADTVAATLLNCIHHNILCCHNGDDHRQGAF